MHADLAPTYEALCEELGWPQDEARLQQMQQHNRDRLQTLDEQLQDAEENLGDIEVRTACLARADFLCSIGEPRRWIVHTFWVQAKPDAQPLERVSHASG